MYVSGKIIKKIKEVFIIEVMRMFIFGEESGDSSDWERI